MTDKLRLEIIEQNPIGCGLEGFRASFKSVCKSKGVSCALDALGQLDHEGRICTTEMSHALLSGKQRRPESRL